MKKKVIIVIVVLIVLGVVGILFSVGDNKDTLSNDIEMFSLGKKEYKLIEGDTLECSAWSSNDCYLNDTKLSSYPVLFNGVTIGTDYRDVIEKFNIKSGYANLNMEVPTEEHDGTTDIIDVLYKNDDSFTDDFLDAVIEFGYEKTSEGWKMVKYSDIDNADILFRIDINGFDDHEEVDENKVIMINIEYLNGNR